MTIRSVERLAQEVNSDEPFAGLVSHSFDSQRFTRDVAASARFGLVSPAACRVAVIESSHLS